MKLALSRFPVGNLTKGAESLREKKWQEKPFIAENRPRPIDRTLQKALNLGFMKNYVKVPAFRPLMVFSGTLFGFLVLASSALSYDPSLPYRSRPGFRCLYQNVRGECLNFEFGNSGGSTSSQSSSTSSRSTVTGDDLTLEVESEDGTTLDRGDTVEFTIRLTNDTGRRIRTDVRAFLDTDMTYSSSTNQGRLRATREVEWDNVSISGDDEEELTLRVRISTTAKTGEKLTLRVETDETDEDAILTLKAGSRIVRSSNSRDCSNVYYIIDGRRVVSSVRTDRCLDDDTGDGNYTISISDTPDPFEPGELLTYTITIRNMDDVSRRFDAIAYLDDNTLFISGSDNPDRDFADRVEWTDLSIGKNGTKTLTLTVRTNRDLDDGDTVLLRVVADNDEATEESEALFR
jgi:hypothetical protein